LSSSSAAWKRSKSRIHSSAVSCLATSILLKTTIRGRRVLYRMLTAWSMLLMNACGFIALGVSTT
jgi:hypothetical protein